VFNTRYGENPHQDGALYQFKSHFSNNFKAIKGEASFNNLTDINGAIKIASSFGDRDAICIVKHGKPLVGFCNSKGYPLFRRFILGGRASLKGWWTPYILGPFGKGVWLRPWLKLGRFGLN